MTKTREPRQRVGLPGSVQVQFKRLAAADGKLLREVFSAAIREQLDARTATVNRGGSVTYIRAPSGLPNQVVDLEPGLLTRLRDVADKDRVSVRSVLFNALTDYAKKNPVV